MKHVHTSAGRPYAVTTSVPCTISTADGVVIVSCEPGQQAIFVAPGNVVQVSADDALVTETFKRAASAVSGGGEKGASENINEP